MWRRNDQNCPNLQGVEVRSNESKTCLFKHLFDPEYVISLVSNSFGLHLDWKTKRLYHIQLEILFKALEVVVTKFTPLIFLGFSAQACACTVSLLHINPTSEGQGCVYCTFLLLGTTGVLAWVVGFVGFRLVEQLSEESTGVLEEISRSITAETMTSECIYGDQQVRRSLPARLFRRSVLRARVGEFRKIESGFALEFFQMTLDNIVSYIYMVNPNRKMWLL